MKVILAHRPDLQIDQYEKVSKIEYDKTTHIYTITYGDDNTVTYYNGNDWLLTVLIS